jgi:hypothetical protein
MMDDQPFGHTTGTAALPIPLQHIIAETAEPTPGMIVPVVAKPALP